MVGREEWIVEQVQRLHGTPLDALFKALSLSWLLWAASLAVVVVVVARGRTALPAVAALIAVPITSVATALLKSAVGRQRPPVADPLVHPLVAVPHDLSFPSGHASSAFAVAFVLGAYLPRLRPLFLIVATLVAASRVWLGVHYPSDVLAGAALGSAVAITTVRIVDARHRRLRQTR